MHTSTLTFALTLASSLAAAILTSTTAWAGGGHEGDIAVEVFNNRIITGLETNNGFVRNRAFGSEFGEGGAPFNFTDEPGFGAEDGVFPADTLVGFNIMAALGVWNGNGFDVAPNTLTVNFGSLERETGTGFVEGFGLPTDSDGGWHYHLGFTLNDVTPDDSGVYLLELELWHGSAMRGSIASSRPFWIVFNFNEDELIHDAAIDWVRKNLVPAPAALALFGLAAVVPGCRRRCV